MPGLSIGVEDPRQPEVAALVRDLDRMFERLYPAESNHLLDIETLAGPAIRFFVLRRGGEAIGCGAIRLTGSDYCEVKRVYVKPETRGLKLGALIIRTLEAEARRAGFGLMRLETGIHQPEALGLFAAAGFERCGPFGDYPKDDPNSIFMEKQLEPRPVLPVTGRRG